MRGALASEVAATHPSLAQAAPGQSTDIQKGGRKAGFNSGARSIGGGQVHSRNFTNLDRQKNRAWQLTNSYQAHELNYPVTEACARCASPDGA